MSYVVIRELFRVQLNAVSSGWADRTAWENVSFTPRQGVAYQAVHLLPGKTLNPSFGGPVNRHMREIGVVQVMLFYPTNAGPEAAALRAEELRDGFPRGLTMESGGVRVLIDRDPYIGSAASGNGWYALPVSIQFSADVFKG